MSAVVHVATVVGTMYAAGTCTQIRHFWAGVMQRQRDQI